MSIAGKAVLARDKGLPANDHAAEHLMIACAYVRVPVQVRYLILHRHGGVWMDTDVIFFQDMTHTLLTSYQFIMRWTNGHVMRLEAGSALTHRLLETAKRLPGNHPNFEEEIVEQICKPVGYVPAHDSYNNMDIYNTCLLRLLMKINNAGPPDAILYDLPLGT